MRNRGWSPPSPSLVISFAALLIAMSGTAVALSRNSVGSAELQRDAVKGRHVARDAIRSRDVTGLKSRDLRDGRAVSGVDVIDDSLTGADIEEATLELPRSATPTGPAGGDLEGVYPNPELAGGSVGPSEVAPDAIGSGKVADDSLTGEDIDESQLDLGPIPPSGPAGGDLSGTYPDPGIAANAVGHGALSPDAFVSSDISSTGSAFGIPASAIQSAEIENGEVTAADIDESTQALGASYHERTSNLTLTTSYAKVIDTDPVLADSGMLVAQATIEVDGDGGNDDHALCYIEIDGANGPLFGHVIPDTLFDRAVFTVSYARAGIVGPHSVDLYCKRNLDPSVVVDDVAMTVLRLPAA